MSMEARSTWVGETSEAAAIVGGARRSDEPEEHAPALERDYIERNRQAWEGWAPAYAAVGREAWQDALRWGIWRLHESELQLLEGVEVGSDAVELGCGTASISAWLARQGLRPVGVDIARAQLVTAGRLQREYDVSFELICANAEALRITTRASTWRSRNTGPVSGASHAGGSPKRIVCFAQADGSSSLRTARSSWHARPWKAALQGTTRSRLFIDFPPRVPGRPGRRVSPHPWPMGAAAACNRLCARRHHRGDPSPTGNGEI